MIQAFSPHKLLELDLPTLTERYILGAAGVSSNITPYEIHRILLRQTEPNHGEFSPAELDLRQHYQRHLQRAYGVSAEPLTPASARVFEGPYMAGRTLVITDPGDLAYSGTDDEPIVAGDVIMIETPARRVYDFVYRNGHETVIPQHVMVRAQIKMAVANANQALIYVVGDNHEIDEFHAVKRDDELIANLIQACRRTIQRVIDNDPPKPDITEDMLLIEGRDASPPLVVSLEDNLYPLIQDYFETYAEERKLFDIHKQAKAVFDEKKKEIQQVMAEANTNKIVDPHMRILTRKLIKVKERVSNAYSYTVVNATIPS